MHGPVYNNRRRLFLCSEPTADPFELRDDGCPISITADEEFVACHARLLRTPLNSLSSIGIGDADGRNGLQCLAEALLTLFLSVREVDSRKCKRGWLHGEPSGSLLD
jgi:hypothetical protein